MIDLLTEPVEYLTDAELCAARAHVGAVKLGIRLRYDLRKIIVLMIVPGEEWQRSGNEWNVKPRFQFPVSHAHRALVTEVRELNLRLEDVNCESERRQNYRVPTKKRPGRSSEGTPGGGLDGDVLRR